MARREGRHQAGAAPSYYDDARARLEAERDRLEAEREKTREVTRELHEMLQAAADTVRALRQAQRDAAEWANALRDDVDKAIRERCERLVHRKTEEINAHYDEGERQLLKRINELRLAVAASADPQQVRGYITSAIEQMASSPDFLERLSRIMLASTAPFAAQAGPVTIQTPDAGHPRPGLYVDGRFLG